MTSVEAWLDGQPLHGLEGTVLLDVIETSLLETDALPHPGALPRRTGLEVTLSAAIRSPDPALRQGWLGQLQNWCRGRILTLSYRPGQQLAVQCILPPAIGSTLRWTEPVTMRFAGVIPYWTDIHPVRQAFPAPALRQETTLTLPGNAPHAPLMMALTAAAPLNRLTIRCGDAQMTLNSLSLSPGAPLTLGEENGRFYLRTGDASLLHCRALGSADTLPLTLGKPNLLQITGDGAFSGRVWAYGRFE